jgi:hypothetical protein
MDDKHAQAEPRFLSFPHLADDATRDGQPVLNKYSTTITKGHDFPGAQVINSLSFISGKLIFPRPCFMLLVYRTSIR